VGARAEPNDIRLEQEGYLILNRASSIIRIFSLCCAVLRFVFHQQRARHAVTTATAEYVSPTSAAANLFTTATGSAATATSPTLQPARLHIIVNAEDCGDVWTTDFGLTKSKCPRSLDLGHLASILNLRAQSLARLATTILAWRDIEIDCRAPGSPVVHQAHCDS
jgi:hypothetical protein